MKVNIKTKLLVGFALLLLLSFLVQALTLSIIGDYIYSNLKNLQTVEANEGVVEIQSFFINLHKINYALASLYSSNAEIASSSAEKTLSNSMRMELFANPQIISLKLLDVNGGVLAGFDKYKRNFNNTDTLLNSAGFYSALNGNSSISGVYETSLDPEPQVDLYTPIFVNGVVSAVLKTQVDLENLRRQLSAIKIGDNGFVLVTDDSGRVVSYPSRKYVLEKHNLAKQKIISSLLSGKQPSELMEQYENENKVIVTSKAARVPGLGWVVVFEQPVSDVLSFVGFLRSIFILNIVGSLILLLGVALLLSENLTSPIKKLIYLTGLLDQGKIDNKIKIQTGDEIEVLAKSFNSMAIRLLQREDYLKKQEKEKDTILQSLSDGVMAVDSEDKVVLFNKEAELITGFSGEELLYKNIDKVLRVYDNDQQLLFEQYKIRAQELTLKLKNKGQYLLNSSGDKLKINLETTPIKDEDESLHRWIITIHDMRKEQELEEMKVDFVSMAAHELRTPLTAIRGYASLINMQNSENFDANGKNLIAHLLVSTDNLNNLIDNLLNISRIERNTLGVQMKPLQMGDLLRNVSNGLKQQAYISNQKIELELPSEPLPLVLADPFRIGQVLSNLIINALNYTQEGSTIKIKARQNGYTIEVSVEDNGPGIKQDAIPRLFTKFFRVSGQPEQGTNGTGLGLFICKSIVEMHKGKIWVVSELNKGTTFTFSLPISS